MYSKLKDIKVECWNIFKDEQSEFERAFDAATACIKNDLEGTIIDVKYSFNTGVCPETFEVINVFSALIIYEAQRMD